jgi:putative ABC transport system permease protein
MFFNFIKVTLRNIASHKLFSVINIFGLAVGIACALIIILYINHEINYDKFHPDYQSVYRITVEGNLQGVEFSSATTSAKMGAYVKKHVEGVEDITRVTRLGAWLIATDSVRFNEDDLLFADSNFLTFFSGFKIIDGDAQTMLLEPKSLVLTESSALKYFGSTKALIGKKVKVEAANKPYTVTGVVSDPPSHTHVGFDMLASLSTYENILAYTFASNNVYSYIRIKDGYESSTVLEQINGLYDSYIHTDLVKIMDYEFDPEDSYRFNLQALEDIHLYSDLQAELHPNGNAIYVYSLGVIAMIILIVACLNFMNLSTANSTNRSFEVSLRKVVGANKRYLIFQFLIEAVVISLLALAIALLLAELILPLFNNYLDLSLEFGLFSNLKAVLLILLLTAGVGILAGSYPAIFIASFDPVKVLNKRGMHGLRSSKIRSVFVVLQFFIAVLVILLTIVVYSQVNFMMSKELGFDNEDILVIRRSDALKDNMEAFKKDILKHPDVLASTNTNSIPGRDFYLNTFKLKGEREESALLFNQVFVNYDFFNTYDLELAQGRFLDSSYPNDTLSCVINESAARLMGLSYPIGAELVQPRIMKEEERNYKVIGVVKDFHFQSLNQAIKPLVICLMPGNWEGYVSVKVNSDDALNTISAIEQAWYKYAPEYPFVHFFLEEDFNKNYDALVKLRRVFIIFSLLSIFIASLGLYGLISNAANQRKQEIGIRKALGASNFHLVFILAKETFNLMGISTVLAWMVAFFAIQYWLSDFYYSISVNPLQYIGALVIVLLITLPSILYHSLRLVEKEPGIALKYE